MTQVNTSHISCAVLGDDSLPCVARLPLSSSVVPEIDQSPDELVQNHGELGMEPR